MFERVPTKRHTRIPWSIRRDDERKQQSRHSLVEQQACFRQAARRAQDALTSSATRPSASSRECDHRSRCRHRREYSRPARQAAGWEGPVRRLLDTMADAGEMAAPARKLSFRVRTSPAPTCTGSRAPCSSSAFACWGASPSRAATPCTRCVQEATVASYSPSLVRLVRGCTLLPGCSSSQRFAMRTRHNRRLLDPCQEGFLEANGHYALLVSMSRCGRRIGGASFCAVEKHLVSAGRRGRKLK